MELHGPLWLGHAGPQGRFFVIDDGALPRGHELFEDPVHRGQHLRAAAEVVAKVDSLARVPGEGGELLQEQPRLRHAKAVDALLHVPHEEQIVGPLDPVQDGLLDRVAVLVLVHDDGREPVPILPGSLRVLQNIGAEVLQIIEVDPVPLPLHTVIDGLLPPPKTDEGQQDLGAGQVDVPLGLPVPAVGLLLGLSFVLHLFPGLLQGLLVQGVHVLGVADPAEGHGGQGLGVGGGGPLEQGAPGVGDHLVQISDQIPPAGGIAVPEPNKVGEGRLEGGLVLPKADVHRPIVGRSAGELFLRFRQPPHGVRLGHQKPGQGLHRLHEGVLPFEGP